MNDLLSFWRGLDMIRRLWLIAATLGVFLAVLGLSRLGSGTGQSLLYAGLDPRTAGEVIAALDQSGTVYEVRGDAIYVSTADRDSLRMQLAGQGLPSTGGQGYELLDGLSGFGTTSQMFDAAYWRAKEGELARTALAIAGVRSARVHISSQGSGAFLRDSKVTASITVTMSSGGLTREQADALRHLVASSIGRMSPSEVTVIDSVSGVIPPGDDKAGAEAGGQRADAIKRNVERLLAARVGSGNAVVEVSVDLVRDREAITERRIDPKGRVAIASESETRSDQATEPSGQVTVASNLPAGDAQSGSAGRSQSTSNRERLNYDVSETQRELLREPGAIRRMTIAVLVDGVRTTDANGLSTWVARSDQELADLRELVVSAAGIDEARGDILTLKSMEFAGIPTAGTEASAGSSLFSGQIEVMSALQMAILATVILVLTLFVVRPVLMQARQTSVRGLERPAPSAALPPPTADARSVPTALSGEIDDGDPPSLSVINPRQETLAEGPGNDPVERLKRLIDSRQEESVEILRGWLEKQEDQA